MGIEMLRSDLNTLYQVAEPSDSSTVRSATCLRDHSRYWKAILICPFGCLVTNEQLFVIYRRRATPPLAPFASLRSAFAITHRESLLPAASIITIAVTHAFGSLLFQFVASRRAAYNCLLSFNMSLPCSRGSTAGYDARERRPAARTYGHLCPLLSLVALDEL
jgi:hypothetical protein